MEWVAQCRAKLPQMLSRNNALAFASGRMSTKTLHWPPQWAEHSAPATFGTRLVADDPQDCNGYDTVTNP